MEKPNPPKIIRGAELKEFVFYPAEDYTLETSSRDSELLIRQDPAIVARLIEQAKNEGIQQGIIQGQKQGYEAGMSDGIEIGIKKGLEYAREDLKEAVDLLNQLSANFKLRENEIFEQAKPGLIRFLLAVCERILLRELSQPETMAKQLECLLNHAKNLIKDSQVEIALAPEDFEMLEQHLHRIVYDREDFPHLHFTTDKGVAQGNCRIESRLGMLNFNIARLLKDIEEQVLEHREEPNSSEERA